MRAAASPPEVQSGVELGSDRRLRPAPVQGRQGHYWVFYRQVSEKLTAGVCFWEQTCLYCNGAACFDVLALTKSSLLFTGSAS